RDQSFQMAPFSWSGDPSVRPLVFAVSVGVRARLGALGRARRRGGSQLHLALGPDLWTGVEQMLSASSENNQQKLSDRRDLYQGQRRGQISVPRRGFDRANRRLPAHSQATTTRRETSSWARWRSQ